jgi:hypothetical protein
MIKSHKTHKIATLLAERLIIIRIYSKQEGFKAHQISRNSVGRKDVDGAADGAVSSVGGEDHDGGDARLERAMEVRETLKNYNYDL